jgi:hypothetical protein
MIGQYAHRNAVHLTHVQRLALRPIHRAARKRVFERAFLRPPNPEGRQLLIAGRDDVIRSFMLGE